VPDYFEKTQLPWSRGTNPENRGSVPKDPILSSSGPAEINENPSWARASLVKNLHAVEGSNV